MPEDERERYEQVGPGLRRAGFDQGGDDTGPPYSWTRQGHGGPGILKGNPLDALDELDRELLERVIDPAEYDRLRKLGARMASTTQLRALIAEAKRRGYNRAGAADDVRLSPEGVHVLSPLLFHRFIAEQPSEEHLRVHALLAEPFTQEAREAILDVPIRMYERLTRLATRERRPDPAWDEVLGLYVGLVEQTVREPASVGFTGPATDGRELLTAVPAGALVGLEPWFVDADMLTLIEASTPGVHEHALDPRDLMTPSGFCVLATPHLARSAGWQQPVPIRGYSWTPAARGLWCFVWLDLYAEPEVAVHAPNYRARLWPAMHFEWPYGEPGNAVLDWANASDDERSELREHRAMLMALWLISGQRIATVTGQQPVRAQRRAAERLNLPTAVNVVTLRRRLPAVYRDEAEHRHVEWSHRWLVRGHWRRIWDEKEQRVRLVWVSAHVKGPDDKPFVTKDRLYKVVR